MIYHHVYCCTPIKKILNIFLFSVMWLYLNQSDLQDFAIYLIYLDIEYIFYGIVFYKELGKESLNSYDQQFHQYQKSKQSPLMSNHWTQNKTTTNYLEYISLHIHMYF